MATNWDPAAEEALMLRIAPLLREIFAGVQEKLPEGTDFGILVFAPSSEPGAEGRVMAISTDRTRMARYAAQWVLTVLPGPRKAAGGENG